ncbi:trypsin-like peptidase domain-containing protein [Pontibacter sp. Tf4]|uniref:S1 family peptidase n=1 Tax=Pontibacter sp. Tf4 TaxID=2761620 RepID=UPI00162A1F42|nr:serine protease [Pontibacter sp. Tf4]MBB6611792.1 trypsin-like peptidase domain-containing protein [Pontibacter sp. Tf4]
MDITNLHQIVFTVGRITPQGVNLLGTCVLLNKDGLFATASHVTNNDNTNLVIVLSPTTDLLQYQDTSNNRVQTIDASIFKVDPVRDICILRVTNSIFSNITIAGADSVKVSDSLAIVGYPHSNYGRQVLTFQTTVVGAKILIESSGIKTKHLVLNIQTRPGQSGSPIFNLSNSQLVGILIGSYAPEEEGGISLGGIDPQTLHQTTHAVSAEYIKNMI